VEINVHDDLVKEWNCSFMTTAYVLIMINVMLTPVVFAAYLSVWMGRRCAGLVAFGECLDSGSYLRYRLES